MPPLLRSLVRLLALAACGGCAGVQSEAPAEVAAPFALVAGLCADVCRIEFPAADPLPYHAGAPATLLADGSYEIRYERRADGRWTPRAAGRLVLPPTAAALPATVHYAAANGLLGWRDAVATLTVRVSSTQGGARVGVRARGWDAEPIVRHVQAALRFALALARPEEIGTQLRACCADHAAWQAIALARAAERRERGGDLLAARDALRAAVAAAPDQPALEQRLGRIERTLGDDRAAARHLRSASRREPDPAARSEAWLLARDSGRRGEGGDAAAIRRAALGQLQNGRLDAAATLAHAALALAPDPLADLTLRHDLQRARGDRFGSLGTALLLREYGADAAIDRTLTEDFAGVGYWALARRAAGRILAGSLPADDLVAALHSAGTALAATPLFGWADAVGAWATPPR